MTKSLFTATSLGILILGATAWASQPAQSPVEKGLRRFLTGKVAPADVEIRYSDLHPLHGGLELTVLGTGAAEVKVVRQRAPRARNLTPVQVRELVALLIELQAWSQRTPERQARPDESRARLMIRIGTERSEIWEWYNDLSANRRIVRVRDRIRRLSIIE